jgi:glycerol-3-phosphate cytidylyltransferase
MKKVITYGTFDLFHEGHQRLLERAKKLGDYLIVGVTTDSFDFNRGKLNVHDTLMERIDNVRRTGLADQIIIEEYEGQKINDIAKYGVDIFAIGSDWLGKFEYMKEYCEVVYLERTKDISSTQLRNDKFGILRIGMVGYGRIAVRFFTESKFVSGAHVEAVFGRNGERVKKFCEDNEIAIYTTDFEELLANVDAVYIASPHKTHFDFIVRSLNAGKHVLCEKPIVLSVRESDFVYRLAREKNLVLLEAIKTAYAPGFIRLISLAKSGQIGEIKSVVANFTKLVSGNLRELDPLECGGSVTELASYPLVAFAKILGTEYLSVRFDAMFDKKKEVDLFTSIHIGYKNAIATASVGLGVKTEGMMLISGTKGYIYVPAPWWKTEYYEVRFEDANKNNKYFYKFEGDGLRYELSHFVTLIRKGELEIGALTPSESRFITDIIETFLKRENIEIIE